MLGGTQAPIDSPAPVPVWAALRECSGFKDKAHEVVGHRREIRAHLGEVNESMCMCEILEQ